MTLFVSVPLKLVAAALTTYQLAALVFIVIVVSFVESEIAESVNTPKSTTGLVKLIVNIGKTLAETETLLVVSQTVVEPYTF